MEDDKLAKRIEEVLKGKRGITSKKMFGGTCFLLHGNMLCGVAKGKLVARVGPEAYESCLKLKNASEMTFTGKPMKGMIYVAKEGCKTNSQLGKWIDRSMDFVKTLPRK